MLATAVALVTDAPVPLVYGLAALVATSITVPRPAQNAILPTLARTPDELTAANVASSWTESVSVLAGPAVAALLLDLSGPGAVFAVMAGLLAARGCWSPGSGPARCPAWPRPREDGRGGWPGWSGPRSAGSAPWPASGCPGSRSACSRSST
ncbi:MAG TPA: hypothetical protein VOA19_14435 [Actinomycetes bacterium]|nr:hypothetical protein [Actinomycetes bacterium]